MGSYTVYQSKNDGARYSKPKRVGISTAQQHKTSGTHLRARIAFFLDRSIPFKRQKRLLVADMDSSRSKPTRTHGSWNEMDMCPFPRPDLVLGEN